MGGSVTVAGQLYKKRYLLWFKRFSIFCFSVKDRGNPYHIEISNLTVDLRIGLAFPFVRADCSFILHSFEARYVQFPVPLYY